MTRDLMIAELKKVKPSYNYNNFGDKQIFRLYQKYVLDKKPQNNTGIIIPQEPSVTRTEKSIEDYEREYEEERGYKTCHICGARLNDRGTCPECLRGEEDLIDNRNPIKFDLPFDESIEDVDDEYTQSITADKVCVICGDIISKYGNNAEPVASGICCDKCNREKVLPERLKMYLGS